HCKNLPRILVDYDRSRAPYRYQCSLSYVFHASVNRQIDVRTRLWLDYLLLTLEPVLCVLLQYPLPGFSTERVIQIQFDIGFALNVRFVKIEILDVRKLVNILRAA